MRLLAIRLLPPLLVAGAGVLAMAAWLSAGPGVDLEPRLPGADSSADQQAGAEEVDIAGLFTPGPGLPADLPGLWPCFRGPDRNAVSTEQTALTRSLTDLPSRRMWSVPLGEGYAGPAVAGGRVYLLDYDQQADADTLRCLSLADGSEIWRRGYHVKVKRNHGMSRTVPAVGDGFVVTIGPKCHVMCAAADTGEFLWGIDLIRQYGATVPDWYTGQCPLIDEGKAVIAPGGSALMIAVDCATGRVVWETPNPNGWRMTHSSVMPMDLAGRRMYVYCASGGVVGVSAEDGHVLWQTGAWTVNMANIPSPVVVGDGRLFLTGGYGSGSMMVRVIEHSGQFAAEELFRLKPQQFGAEQQTPVLYEGHIFGLRQDGQLVCLDLDGNILWESGRTNRFGDNGRGPCLIADGMLLVLGSEGTLSLIEASAAGFHELSRADVLTHGEAWGPTALAGGRLLARDLVTMTCLDIRAEVPGHQELRPALPAGGLGSPPAGGD